MLFSNSTLSKLFDCSAVFFFAASVFSITAERFLLGGIFLLAGAALAFGGRNMKYLDDNNDNDK